MIATGHAISPFNKSSFCGDRVCEIEAETATYFLCTDIGGHGTKQVGRFADDIVDLFAHYCCAESMKSLLQRFAQHPMTKSLGMAFILGRIDKHLGLLQYTGIGNLSMTLLRNGESVTCEIQGGMFGLTPDIPLPMHGVKLQTDDLIVIHSDGMSSAGIDYLIATPIIQNDDLSEISAQCLEDYESKNDDSLLFLARVNGTPHLHQPRPCTLPSTSGEALLETTVQPPAVNVMDDVFMPTPRENGMLPEKYLLVSLSRSALTKHKLCNLCEVVGLASSDRVQLMTCCAQLCISGIASVLMYSSTEYLQVVIKGDEAIQKQIFMIFGADKVWFDPNATAAVIQYKVNHPLTEEELDDLREMLRFGVDKTDFEMFRANRKKDQLLHHQSKLASMGEMLGSIAHQWRQPLNELSLRVQQLDMLYSRDKISDAFMAGFKEKSMQSIQYMSQTIDDFRNFFRQDKTKTEFDILTTCEEILGLQESQLSSHHIQAQVIGERWKFYGVKSELQQVIINLVSNARDALKDISGQDRIIQIRVSQGAIEITDNGGGIPENVLPRVFEPYYTTKAIGEGTGLGLYMCKLIIEDNIGGSLDMQTVAWEKGTGARATLQLIKS